VLLNPIYTQFPGGYSPLFGAKIKDHEVVRRHPRRIRGNIRWDVHARTRATRSSTCSKARSTRSLGACRRPRSTRAR
jgi:iron complex outermembrane receptor protein